MFSAETRDLEWFAGKNVTVMGLGLFGGGRGVTEFLCRLGARVTVTDSKPAEKLAQTLREVEDLPVRWVLGEHREEDFVGADLVIANPAVPRTAPLLAAARTRGVPIDTEMNLFFKYCRGRICGVTGSNGKTTTTSLLGAMARRHWPRARLGGNLGKSLLGEIDDIGPEDWVVLELSSFQLEDLAGVPRRPDVSVVINLSPNHLDRHGTYEAYAQAKAEILAPPGASTREGNGAPRGAAVLWGDDPLLRSWNARTRRRIVYFGRAAVRAPRAPGVWIGGDEGDEVFRSGPDGRQSLFHAADLQLRGRFNLLNAAAAAAAASFLGIPDSTIRAAVRDFHPVTHRLELFLVDRGVEYFDDSIATTPESTIAALEALGPRVLLICGGSPKGCSFRQLGEAIGRGTKAVFLIGSTAAEIEAAIRASRKQPPVHRSGDLASALQAARALAAAGDRVVLSPACPSYDQFLNFEDRGRRFKALAREAASRATDGAGS